MALICPAHIYTAILFAGFISVPLIRALITASRVIVWTMSAARTTFTTATLVGEHCGAVVIDPYTIAVSSPSLAFNAFSFQFLGQANVQAVGVGERASIELPWV
jgi:hypothetical protein